MAKENFFKAHWDWLVAAAGGAALVVSGVYLVGALGESREDGEASCQAELSAARPAHEGVAEVDLSVLQGATRGIKTPPTLSGLDAKKSSFLASERRVFCRKGDPQSTKEGCGRPIPAESEVCPLCGVKQQFVKVEIDSDHDGLPNDWEVRHGLNPNDASDAQADLDKDGFTNAEEFAAKTDPRDPESHPDYLDSLYVTSPLNQTTLPFWFNSYQPIPGGHRFTLQRVGKSGYGAQFTPKLNEEISSVDGKVKTGWVVVGFEQKEEKRSVKGSKIGLKKSVDVSELTVERKQDHKRLKLVMGSKSVTVESQVQLTYRRGEEKILTVTAGQTIELNGRKYRVVSLQAKDGKCVVTVEDLKTKKTKVVQAA